MKRKLVYILFGFALSFLVVTTPACSKKTGCPMNEMTNKDEKLSTKRGKSSLFPKKMRRK